MTMTLHFPRHRIALLLASLPFALPGHAASFDCTRAAASFERAVCADPQVSAADTAMAQRYAQALAQLSDAGKRIVQYGQRQWLRYARTLCIGHPVPGTVAECLQRAYDERLDDLKLAAVRAGPYLFSRIDFYAAANPDEAGVLSEGQIAVPRIDAPLTPATLAWNQVMAQRFASTSRSAGCDGPSGDYATNYKIGGVTRTTINIVTSDSMYCHGTAHPYGAYKSLTYIMAPAPHLLQATDVFRPDTAWRAFLVKRSAQKLQAEYAASPIDLKALDEAVRTPEAWTIDRTGLGIKVRALNVGAGPGMVDIAIPWADLQPFLTAAAADMR
jgi:uncharacterized protein